MDDDFQISYEGVTLGVPVLTKDGEEFGILEHVLAVEEEDIFEGIVVWVGGGTWAQRKVQRELSMVTSPPPVSLRRSATANFGSSRRTRWR